MNQPPARHLAPRYHINPVMYIALLRGINVGGNNKLAMGDLAEIFRDAGCSSVTTYIQSGNVIFEADAKLADRVPKLVAATIADRFGYRVPVILRSSDEFQTTASLNPLLRAGTDPKALHVVFLADTPEQSRVQTLDPNRSPPDEFAVVGREICLRCPNGLARTKLTNAYFDSKLNTTATIRNWNTILKLTELSTSAGKAE